MFTTVARPTVTARSGRKAPYSEVLADMIKAFHEGTDDGNAVAYVIPETETHPERVPGRIRAVARSMDDSVTVRYVVEDRTVTFWLDKVRKYVKADKAPAKTAKAAPKAKATAAK